MKDDMITGQDLYFRKDGGPVQHVRVWDRVLYLTALDRDSRNDKEPFTVQVSCEEDYAKQRKQTQRRA